MKTVRFACTGFLLSAFFVCSTAPAYALEPAVKRTAVSTARQIRARVLNRRAVRQNVRPVTATQPAATASVTQDGAARVALMAGLKLVNDARAKNRLPALQENTRLTAAAQSIAEAIDKTGNLKLATQEGYVVKTLRATGYYPKNDEQRCERITFRGIQLVGRNPAAGTEMVADWLSIAQYREQLLAGAYTEVGVGKKASVWLFLLQQKTAAPKAGADGASQASLQAEILTLVNKERATAGLAPLVRNTFVDLAAQRYAEEMQQKGFYDHVTPDGRDALDRLIAAGVPVTRARHGAVGENIAKGQQSAAEVMEGWMNSEGHRRNILSPDYDQIGIGAFCEFWVQDFMGPQS